MTAGHEAVVPPASVVAELIQALVKALRAFQMYLPNNPIYQRAIGNVRSACAPVWEVTDEPVLHIVECDLVWEEQVVYHQPTRAESFAWSLYKDGMRTLSLRRGCEEHEIVRFLETLNRAKFLPADASDDLLTLLWEQEFLLVHYRFAEVFGDEAMPGIAPPAERPASPEERRTQVQEEAPPRPKGVVDIDAFDSTLYFLDEAEIQYVVQQVEEEYRRDARGSALAAMYDIFEAQPQGDVRSEIVGIVEQLFPNLLNGGEFRAAASVLREMRLLASRAPELQIEHRQRLEAFDTLLSEPDIVRQLVQALDEASTRPDDTDVADLLRELRQTALETLLVALPALSSPGVRQLLEAAADRLATAYPSEVLRMLRSSAADALPSVVALCGRLKLYGAVPGLTETLLHPDAAVRLASVQSLSEIATPGALTQLERAIEAADSGVRLAAVRAVGTRGYKGALRRVEAVVLGKSSTRIDLTEKMAFFEAYGAIAGTSGLDTLGGLLLSKGLLRFRSNPETRACAATAIGKVRSADARELLRRASDDKELVVRNAVSRALREQGTK